MATSTASKEKGNAAFKAGDYATAIGHYSAAALADPSDPTFFLNRAAAYLKLSKNEDAERDCTTVLALSKTNVKALFRRAQAHLALQKLGEAHNDLQRALKLEPNNEAVRTELARVDELIVSKKQQAKTRSAPIEISTPPLPAPAPASSSSRTAHAKRRRVPITIVDDQPSPSANVPRPTDDEPLKPISSRVLPPDDTKSTTAIPTPTPATVQNPKPTSFREAKQVRDAKSAGRVGGGIFRLSGKDTVFKTREVPAPATAPAPAPAPPLAPAPAPAPAAHAPPVAPRTVFEFTRAWDRIPATDTAQLWALLNTIPPASLPALFGASLEPALLASFIPVLTAAAAAAAATTAPERGEVTSTDALRTFMCALTRVPRFRTVVQFLSRAERNAARDVWEAVVQDASTEEVEVAARTWGFVDTRS